MIELVAVNNIISIIICLASFVRLYKSSKQNNNLLVREFSKSYLHLGLFFLVMTISLPGLIKINIFQPFFFASSYFFMFLALGYFISIPVGILKRNILQKILFTVSVFLGVTASITNLIVSGPARSVEIKYFNYLDSPEPAWFSISVGTLLGLLVLLNITFFIIEGLKIQSRIIRIKSFLISAGMAFLLLASIINFMLVYLSNFSFISYPISSILSWIGLLIILGSITSQEDSFL